MAGVDGHFSIIANTIHHTNDHYKNELKNYLGIGMSSHNKNIKMLG
jgi:hypothetical protein